MVSVRNALFGLLSLTFCMPLIAQETVRIAVGEWPPYLSENALHYGVAAHIVEGAFQASDMNVEVDFLPWARVLVYVESGQYDASILWVKTQEREARFLFSEVILEGEAVFFYHRDNPLVWQEYKDLNNKRFGGLRSASYPWFDAARAAGANVVMEFVSTEQQNFSKLLSQRIDAYALDKLVGLHILQHDFANRQNDISYDPTPIETWPYRLIFTRSPRGVALAEAFNQGLEAIKERKKVQVHLNNVANGVYLPME